MDIKLSFEQQKKVVDSLETNQVTKETANERLQYGNQEMENKWKDKTYLEHEEQIEKEYYPLWKRQDKYREKLDSIPKTHVEGALEGSFEAQEQPEEKSYWKSRKKERTKIEEYKTAHAETKARFDKNTVREMNELDKYRDYHNDYFRNREDQNVLKEAYVLKDQDTKLVKEWRNGILLQKKKFTLALGKEEGPAAELKKTVIETIYGNQTEYSREQEMDEGLRAFFSMTKKGFFRTKQLGLLGTETRSERKDGFEYNKRLLRVYTQGSDAQKAALMDELADKLLNFNLTPQMFTNKYMAKNMLQMQRYTDMLKGFVTLSKYNPGYLDVLNKDAAHTSPEKAALIRSRIILMAPIMENFMQQHAAYFGYKKRKGVTGRNLIDASASNFKDEESYNAFVKQTWEKIKLAYNSTADFLGDFAEAQLEGILKNTESQASKNREDRKLNNQDADQDDSIFGLKYDVDGERAKRLLSLRNRISSNPQIYDIFGSELERLFNRANEMARHLDELETRSESLKKMQDDPELLQRSGIDKFGNMWKTYVKRETDRLDAECVIL
ncbi:MAG: hypothetical protein IJU93_03535, partial [Lachnospiraceae bacterium]|nr:hypothetical protein [Lachnospiraceae bacterium]